MAQLDPPQMEPLVQAMQAQAISLPEAWLIEALETQARMLGLEQTRLPGFLLPAMQALQLLQMDGPNQIH